MTFRDQGWSERVTKLGDEAEQKFMEWADKKGLGYVEYGLRRPPLRMYELPARIRYTPDFLMSKVFIEAQGFGRDNVAKLKIDKAGCLHWWNDVHPTYLFWWDSYHERSTFMHIQQFDQLLPQAEIRSFSEGKPYYAVSGDLIFANGIGSPGE